jgi:hypothetical protein
MWTIKKNTFILSWNKTEHLRSWVMIRILMVVALSILFIGGNSCERAKQTESGPKTNSPPVITSIQVLPENPNIEGELNLFIQSQDPDGDSITYQYQWVRNDEEILGETKNSLKMGNLKKGDLIRVKVTPHDGKVNGATFQSARVKVINSPPVIQEVRIEPKVAYATDRLKAVVKSSDQDGDFIYFTYQWTKNGAVLNEEKGEVLEQGLFKKGDSIVVAVTPDDREVQGSPKKSEGIVISNSPPIILSSPPISVEKTVYLYPVKANDPDNDPVTYTLKSGPKGMEIDKKTGLIKWEVRKEDQGDHNIELDVSDDAGGKCTQRYKVKVDVK